VTKEGDSVFLDTNKPHVTAQCPCGGQYTAGSLSNGDAAVLHSIPYCENFDKLEPIEFMRVSRLGGAMPIDGGGWKS
jgi:hypothetical protein